MSLGSSLSGAFGGQNTYQAAGPYSPDQYGANSGQVQKNLAGVNAGENTLAAQLAAQSLGKGPNPAQAQYNLNTQGNIQQAAGIMASQRGINPALAARASAQAAATAGQTAAGQGAVTQAQQQLGAQSNLAGVYNSQAGQQIENQQVMNQGMLGMEGINSGVAQNNSNNAQSAVGGLLNSGASAAAMFAAKGGQVPGKASVQGDSPKNDTVPAVLSPGEVVLPRHVMSAKNAPDAAKKFVQALMEKESEKKQKFSKGGSVTPGQGLSAILQAQASLHERMKKLEGKGKKAA